MNNEYKGFPLFNDIEDVALKQRNRAVIMANIAEKYTKAKKISLKGASLIIGYFNEVPLEDRKTLEAKFTEVMKERNYVTT